MRRVFPLVVLLALVVPAAAAEPQRPRWQDYALTATLEGHTALVRSIAFSPDGKTVVTGGSDRALKVWDVATGKARAAEVLPRSG